MIEIAMKQGARYWDPANKSVVYILKQGMASGRSLGVAKSLGGNYIRTVMTGFKVLKNRFIPWP